MAAMAFAELVAGEWVQTLYFRVDIQMYQHEISTSVDITVYQYGKMFYIFL
jgi:hypothetical protein